MKKRNAQNKVLQKSKPGVKALREIQFYQRCQTFLIPVVSFQRLVREVCDDLKITITHSDGRVLPCLLYSQPAKHTLPVSSTM